MYWIRLEEKTSHVNCLIFRCVMLTTTERMSAVFKPVILHPDLQGGPLTIILYHCPFNILRFIISILKWLHLAKEFWEMLCLVNECNVVQCIVIQFYA